MEKIEVVNFALAHKDNRRNIASQVQHCVDFDCAVALAVLGPWKQRQAQIDHRRIQRIDGALQIDGKTVADVKLSGGSNQDLAEVGVDAPIAYLVCVRQSVPCDTTANAHVIELCASGT